MTSEVQHPAAGPARRRTGAGTATAAVLVSVTVSAMACGSNETRSSGDAAASASHEGSDGVPSLRSPIGGDRRPVAALAALEETHQARLGVFGFDTGTGVQVSYRADERFPYASTIKALAAGAVLEDLTNRELARRVHYAEADLVEHSPVTELHVEDGLTVRQLIDAAITVSDNTAANLLFDLLGGPAALDAALAEDTGDEVTQVVRREPDLNTAVPGDPRDTTTPAALATTLGAYVLGDVLPTSDRQLLDQALRRNTTGGALIRAGVPEDWRVGDKTGSAAYGTRNDVAVLRPPGRAPIVLAILTTHDDASASTDDRLVAEAAKVVVNQLAH